MSVINSHRLTVCSCCISVIADGDDSSCKDYYGHEHECNLGLEANETAVAVIREDDSTEFSSFRCAGCGDDYVGDVHYVDVLTEV